MNFLHKAQDPVEGDVVEVFINNPANVQLLDPANFEEYSQGRRYRYQDGGYVTESPAQLTAPSAGRWYLTIDLGGGGPARSARRTASGPRNPREPTCRPFGSPRSAT